MGKKTIVTNGWNKIFLEKLALPTLLVIIIGVGTCLWRTVGAVGALQAAQKTGSPAVREVHKRITTHELEISGKLSDIREDLAKLKECMRNMETVKVDVGKLYELYYKRLGPQ